MKQLLTLSLTLILGISCWSQTEQYYMVSRGYVDIQDSIDRAHADSLFALTGAEVEVANDTIGLPIFVANAQTVDLTSNSGTNYISWTEKIASNRVTLSGDLITVDSAGLYRFSGNISTQVSLNQRFNGQVFLEQNSSLSTEWMATGYSRANGGQDQTTLTFEFIAQASAGDQFKILVEQEGGQTTAVNVDANASSLIITGLDNIIVTGVKGDDGVPGAIGPAGPPGGRTILSGTADPTAGLGEDGDFYIDEDDFLIYGPKTAGVWGNSTSIIGPTGPPGDDASADGNGVISELPSNSVNINASNNDLAITSLNGINFGLADGVIRSNIGMGNDTETDISLYQITFPNITDRTGIFIDGDIDFTSATGFSFGGFSASSRYNLPLTRPTQNGYWRLNDDGTGQFMFRGSIYSNAVQTFGPTLTTHSELQLDGMSAGAYELDATIIYSGQDFNFRVSAMGALGYIYWQNGNGDIIRGNPNTTYTVDGTEIIKIGGFLFLTSTTDVELQFADPDTGTDVDILGGSILSLEQM